ncbi:MAG: M3 family metallopeptidase, partial [Flavobacteriaceae bacterium]
MKNIPFKSLSLSIGVVALLVITACADQKNDEKDMTQNNTLLKEWGGSYQGVPAFDTMQLEDLKPAMEIAMERHLEEIDSIAGNPDAPTFENTLLSMEKAGRDINRVFTYYGIWSSNMSTPEFREIQKELSPKISEYRSKISQNKALFERIKAVYDNSQETPLPPEAQRLTELTYLEFEMNGANLNEEDKKRYAAINKELSSLYTTFSNNVLNDEESYVTYITEDQLGGLPESFINASAKAAADRDQEGKYAITNTRSSMDPFLTYSDERDLREKVWRTYYSRGDNEDEYDNNEVISQILKLRHERVQLLGYENFAEWRLQDRMAKTPENAMELMETVWPAGSALALRALGRGHGLTPDREAGHDTAMQKNRVGRLH